MASSSDELTSRVAARVHGGALVAYFVLLPYVVVWKWRLSAHGAHTWALRLVLATLALFWLGFLLQVLLKVFRLRRGRRVRAGASAWVAGLLVGALALVMPTTPSTTRTLTTVTTPYRAPLGARHESPTPRLPLALSGALPMALMAKRRLELLRDDEGARGDLDVDESIALLRQNNPDLLARVVALVDGELDGVLEVNGAIEAGATGVASAPLVACVLRDDGEHALVSFAHEGGRLRVAPTWRNEDVIERVVALHEGTTVFATGEAELLRLLATRSIRRHAVLYLGDGRALDDELAACAITLTPYVDKDATEHVALARPATRADDLRVELLRADPDVVGLVEAFTPTLRRRCVEMTAYLALHRHEPVTGERLRTRVLTHADVDASVRTLANTASAVRRSLGVDARGPRLHPVTSSGLYVTHGLSSDVEIFTTLVSRARQLSVDDGAPLAHQALLLIKGEPLASALRGFEWFLAEGHGARLARDAEWAALALSHAALARRNFELAYWALQQGLLADPYSDALRDAQARVPRLREFGGDGTRRAQDQAVGARGAVAMSWSFAGLSQQVSQ